MNDIIFTFGEKAFVTYYNAKLKEGYENFHSFVNWQKENKRLLSLNWLLGLQIISCSPKSISLQGTKRKKKHSSKSNDPSVIQLYEKWFEKQQLIRQYFKSSEPATAPFW